LGLRFAVRSGSTKATWSPRECPGRSDLAAEKIMVAIFHPKKKPDLCRG